MEEFKQWYDDQNRVFTREFRLFFSQCTIKHEMSFCEMLKLTSDIAVEDYRGRGISIKVLADHDIFILVSRMALRFHRMPVGDETIQLSTWEETPDPFQLRRAYEFRDINGIPLISSISSWILINPVSRRIMKTKDFTLRKEPVYSPEHDCMEYGKIIVPAELVQLNQRPICYSDLDGNGHTNNSRYGAFTIDCLPETYRDKQFTDFRINFVKEAVIGDMLQMYGAFDDNTHKITVVGKKISNGETAFESELFYK